MKMLLCQKGPKISDWTAPGAKRCGAILPAWSAWFFGRNLRITLGEQSDSFTLEYLETTFMRNKLLTTGLIGTIIAALCCFTPVLVILLGAVGLSAVVGYLDYVLLPALAIFIAITLYAFWKRRTA